MVDIKLWTNYLQGRDVSADKISKLKTATNGKVDDIDDSPAGSQKIDLSDGLNVEELKALGITASTIDYVIDDSWALINGSARTAGAIEINEQDLTKTEAGMKAWAELHGIPLNMARTMYYAEPTAVHRENDSAIKTAKDSAISALNGDTGLWKGYDSFKAINGNDAKTFKQFLVESKKIDTSLLTWLDFEPPKSANDLVRLAYISTLSDKAQEAYSGTGKKILIKYSPIGEGIYDAKQIEDWILTSKPSPAATTPAITTETAPSPVASTTVAPTPDEPPAKPGDATAAAVIDTKAAEKPKAPKKPITPKPLPSLTKDQAINQGMIVKHSDTKYYPKQGFEYLYPGKGSNNCAVIPIVGKKGDAAKAMIAKFNKDTEQYTKKMLAYNKELKAWKVAVKQWEVAHPTPKP